MTPDWSGLARRLADQVAKARGHADPAWHAAVAAVPRHTPGARLPPAQR
ncbi:MAG TPA: hypothetical protein VLJ59_01110 [Mycobacteriales bacterium]|nr:hypothetical protein [Mycobacteriales bacterium]